MPKHYSGAHTEARDDIKAQNFSVSSANCTTFYCHAIFSDTLAWICHAGRRCYSYMNVVSANLGKILTAGCDSEVGSDEETQRC